MTVLKLVDATKQFGGVTVVNKVSVAVEPGKVQVLLGENGAGKSTIIKMMSGVYQPDGGHVEIDGKTVTIPNVDAAKKFGIAVIHQELTLVPQLTVMENLYLGDLPTKGGLVDYAAMRKGAIAGLKRIGLKVDLNTPMGELGVATQQMIEIARALMQNASVLILDEPTAALTRDECEQLFTIVDQLKEQGVAMVFISHHLDEIARVGDSVTVLRDGNYIKTVPADTEEDELVKLMVGRDITNQYPRVAQEPGEVLLSVKHLTNSRLKDVSFDVRAGEVVGLSGLVGAGRTETLRAIFGADKYESGSVEVEGKPLKKHSISAAIASGIGLVPEDRRAQGLIMGDAVSTNLGLASMIPTAHGGIVNQSWLSKNERDTAAQLRIRMANINQEAGSLSGGNQQKIVFGKWTIKGVKILLLDEPTRGVDVGARVEIYELINKITANGGAVLMASSDMPEVMGMSDRILVMSAGRISGEMPASEATQEKIMALAVTHLSSASNDAAPEENTEDKHAEQSAQGAPAAEGEN